MMSRALLPSFLVCLLGFVLFGCAGPGKPVVWQASNVSLTDYRVLEFRPVSNATGMQAEQRIAEVLTADLWAQFEKNQLPMVPSTSVVEGVLLMQSELLVYIAYEPAAVFRSWYDAGAGTSRCTLRVRLFDKTTNQMVAEVVTAKDAPSGGSYSIPVGPDVIMYEAPRWVLLKTAEETAEAITRILQSGGPGS